MTTTGQNHTPEKPKPSADRPADTTEGKLDALRTELAEPHPPEELAAADVPKSPDRDPMHSDHMLLPLLGELPKLYIDPKTMKPDRERIQAVTAKLKYIREYYVELEKRIPVDILAYSKQVIARSLGIDPAKSKDVPLVQLADRVVLKMLAVPELRVMLTNHPDGVAEGYDSGVPEALQGAIVEGIKAKALPEGSDKALGDAFKATRKALEDKKKKK